MSIYNVLRIAKIEFIFVDIIYSFPQFVGTNNVKKINPIFDPMEGVG